jgi:signal transduction histidine kinase
MSDTIKNQSDWLKLPCLTGRLRHDAQRSAIAIYGPVEELIGKTPSEIIGECHLGDLIHRDNRERVRKRLQDAADDAKPYTLEYGMTLPSGEDIGVIENGMPFTAEDGAIYFDVALIVGSEWRMSLDQQLAAIVDIGTDTAVIAGDLIAAVPRITETAARFVNCARVSVWLMSEDGTELVLLDLFEQEGKRHSSDLSLQCSRYPRYFHALRHQRLIAANNARTDPRTREFTEAYLTPLNIHSMLDATIRVQGLPTGVICFEEVGEQRIWKAESIHFAGEVADQISQLLLHQDRQRVLVEKEALRNQLFQAQKLEAVGRLAGAIAHDFNNLLNVISGCSDLLISDIVSDPAERASILQDISDTAKRATELTRQLLIFSSGGSSEVKIINVASVVADMYRLMQRLLTPAITLKVKQDNENLLILGSVNQLEQVISNLIVNAKDAMPDGGSVSITTKQTSFVDSFETLTGTATAGVYVAIHVSDSGSGIQPKLINEIFQPFFSTKRSLGGTGLGLSTVYGIVSQWKGHILVRSHVGVGTTFEILLPLAQPEAPPKAKVIAEPAPAPNRSHETILFVEDEAVIRSVARRVLEHVGYTVIMAENGYMAREILLQAHSIDLVLSDLNMPKMGGIALSKWIREQIPTMRILLMTGFRDPNSKLDELNYPIVDKPFTATTLLKEVRKCLDQQLLT